MGDVLEINGRTWRTPVTAMAPRTAGTARLVRRNYRGIYHYEGTGGYEFYRTRGWMKVTALQRRHGREWKTWMVDDPLHWDGMREAVSDLPDGRVLVAGLGLGLMLHHMAAQPRFRHITVVELDADVISLIRPTLPADARVEIVNADFYRYLGINGQRRGEFDGVLWDLAVGKPQDTWRDMVVAQAHCAFALPGVPLVRFGIRRQKREEVAACAQA